MFTTEYKTIGLNVLKYRRLKNMTQEELALEAGVSRSKISNIERGNGPYSIEILFLISKALDIEYSRIVGIK